MGAAARRVQLVLSDIAMPGMSGTQLADIVSSRYPLTPVLLMSGQGGPASDYPCPFLPKPFTADALLNAVGRLLPPTHRPGRV
jgi:DNA-binding NtrC family response regulator